MNPGRILALKHISHTLLYAVLLTLFFFIPTAKQYLNGQVQQNELIEYNVDEHLGCFQFLLLLVNVSLNILVSVSFFFNLFLIGG